MLLLSTTPILSALALSETVFASADVSATDDDLDANKGLGSSGLSFSTLPNQQEWSTAISTITTTTSTPSSRQSLQAIQKLNLEQLCAEKGGYDAEGVWWHYWYKSADCDTTSGNRRSVKYICGARYRRLSRTIITNYNVADQEFYTLCPERTVCQSTFLPVERNSAPVEEIGCVDETDLVKETVHKSTA